MRFITTFGCALVALCVLTTPVKALSLAPTDLGSLAKFLSNEKVRTALNLSASQREQLDSEYSSLRSQVRRLVLTTPSNPAARAAADVKLKGIMKSSNHDAYSVLSKQQKAGLLKLEAKHLGGTLLLSNSVQTTLGVTAAQKAQIASIHAGTTAQYNDIEKLYQQGKTSFREKISRFHDARVQEAPKLMNVLTPAQKTTFTQLGS
ncbi:MAG: hypothetical protein ABI615_06450 [Chthoniobacterales bacterium]